MQVIYEDQHTGVETAIACNKIEGNVFEIYCYIASDTFKALHVITWK